MPTVYRQYRPQRFDQVSGQSHITDTLQQAVLQDRISHAYLFQGPRGTGKTSTARIFAKRLNCKDAKDAEPCGTCATCVATQEHRNIDIIEIDAASNRGIDDIRALRENSNLSPVMSTYKVYIIDEVHMLTNEAFAALLKVLEEPVPHIVFILATTELHKVPATILSRCQVYRFRRATDTEMRDRLTYILKKEKRKADDEVIEFIIKRSDGCYRDAESLLGQLLVMKEETITKDILTDSLGLPSITFIENFLESLVTGDVAKAIEIIDSMYQQGFDPEQCIQESIRMARDAIVAIAKRSKSIPAFAQSPHASARLTISIRALVQATQDLAYVPQPLIALQLAAMTACVSATQKPQITPAQQPQQKTVFTQPQAAPQPAVQQQSQSIPAKSSAPTTPPAAPSTSGVVSVEQAQAAWPALIQEVKKTNPVASTFLRAVEPMSIDGNILTLRVSYPLHRTFFDKPEQKKLVEDNLSKILEQAITIRCQLESTQLKPAAQAQQPQPISQPQQVMPKPSFQPQQAQAPQPAQAKGSDVYDITKEVFG